MTSSIPSAYAYVEMTSTGYRQIEIYPVPSAAVLLRFQYLKTNTLVNGTDTPLYRADVLVWKSGASAAYLLLAKTGDAAWAQLAQSYTAEYDKSLLGAKLDDLGKNSPASRIRDVYWKFAFPSDLAISHDFYGW